MPIKNNPDVPLDNKQLRMYDSTGKFLRVSVDEAIARGYNSWNGWKCSAGVRGLYFDYDGNIWIANCASTQVDRFNRTGWRAFIEDYKFNRPNPEDGPRLFLENEERLKKEFAMSGRGFNGHLKLDEHYGKQWGFVGNIYEGIIPPTDYATCKFDKCGCGADIFLSKAKNDHYAQLLDVTKNGYAGTTRVDNFTDTINDDIAAVEMNFEIPYQILWDISRRCNYDCAYCWPSVHNNKEEFPSYETVISAIDMAIDKWSHGKQIRWNFGGGEPTMHPRFIDILKHLKNRGQWVLITTNGSRSTKFWKEAVTYVNSVIMSAHFASMDMYKGNEDRFIENCKIIMDHHDRVDGDHWIEIKLMTPPGFLDRAKTLRDKILGLNLLHTPGANNRMKGAISFVPIRDITASSSVVDYTTEELDFFKKQ